MSRCIVQNCKSHQKRKKANISFHKFPIDEYLLRKWLETIGVDTNAVCYNKVICSLHFKDNDFSRRSHLPRLLSTALPSQNLPTQKAMLDALFGKYDLMCGSEFLNIYSTKTPSPSNKRCLMETASALIITKRCKQKQQVRSFKSPTDNIEFISTSSDEPYFNYDAQPPSVISEDRLLQSSTSMASTSSFKTLLTQEVQNISKLKLAKTISKLELQTKKIKVLQQRNRRFEKQIACLKHKVSVLKERNYVLEEQRKNVCCTDIGPISTIYKDHDYVLPLDTETEEVVSYIAGCVSQYLVKKVNCDACIKALLGSEEDLKNSVICFKNSGSLRCPNDDVITICKYTEKLLKTEVHCKINKPKIVRSFLRFYISDPLFNNINCPHSYLLAESVINWYLNIRVPTYL